MNWAAYRAQIRRSILDDVDASIWEDDQLTDNMIWAMNTFCTHTALPKEVIYNAETVNPVTETPYNLVTDKVFHLPSDLFDNFDTTGAVAVMTSDRLIPFDPANRTRGMSPAHQASPAFFVYMNTLRLSQPVGEGNQLILRYFAYYPTPQPDDLEGTPLLIPVWAHKPVASLTGSYALEMIAIQSATIDRWKDRGDSGNPEQNSLRAQQSHMRKQYEHDILKYPPQDRENFFRELNPWDIRVWR